MSVDRSSDDVHVLLGDDHVAVVEIDRPPNNFFSVAMINHIADAYEHLAGATSCRAIVLCASGKHFCAGADMAAPAEHGGPHLYDAAIRLFEAPLPVVAAVQGGAVGGGLGLAMSADFRVASPEARFTANFSRLGFHHGFALTATLPPVVGHQRALELLYTGRRLTGGQAMAIGLCDRLASAELLRDEATTLAREIAGSAPLAVRSIRETMRRPLAEEARACLEREKSEQDRLRRTADFREGVAAMAARRTPDFHAR